MFHYSRSAGYFLRVGLLTAALSVGAPAAHAASVSYFLDQSNAWPDGTSYLKVTLDDEGVFGAINFNIQTLFNTQTLASFSGITAGGIREFGFNGLELDKRNIVGLPDGWKFKHDKKMNEFGRFENILVGHGWDGRDSLAFSIVGIEGDSIASYGDSHDGGNNLFFSARVSGYSSNCKHKDAHACKTGAFIAGGQPTPVPVPAAIWLFGSGLLGLLGRVRQSATRRLQPNNTNN